MPVRSPTRSKKRRLSNKQRQTGSKTKSGTRSRKANNFNRKGRVSSKRASNHRAVRGTRKKPSPRLTKVGYRQDDPKEEFINYLNTLNRDIAEEADINPQANPYKTVDIQRLDRIQYILTTAPALYIAKDINQVAWIILGLILSFPPFKKTREKREIPGQPGKYGFIEKNIPTFKVNKKNEVLLDIAKPPSGASYDSVDIDVTSLLEKIKETSKETSFGQEGIELLVRDDRFDLESLSNNLKTLNDKFPQWKEFLRRFNFKLIETQFESWVREKIKETDDMMMMMNFKNNPNLVSGLSG